jgi:hypothetical protein
MLHNINAIKKVKLLDQASKFPLAVLVFHLIPFPDRGRHRWRKEDFKVNIQKTPYAAESKFTKSMSVGGRVRRQSGSVRSSLPAHTPAPALFQYSKRNKSAAN